MGKSVVVDSTVNILRVSVANEKLAEALAISPREVLVNGLAAGETSLIIWHQGGARIFYDLNVKLSTTRIDAVRHELSRELPGQDVTITFESDTVFLRGTVKDVIQADRAEAIAKSLGKTVNLLRVNIPPAEKQILLRVRFANVDRGASTELGVNLFSTGAGNTPASTTTGQYSSGKVEPGQGSSGSTVTLADALNVFLFRKDLNLGATIKALQGKRLLEVLAEPNVLAINGKPASFISGGEFPFPTLQGGSGGGLAAVTIAFREFGIRINFLPVITPRGTIRLQVMPEVSSLDFANGLTFQGNIIPALSTRRVQTEVELESGQSFAIAGLIDNRLTESLSKVPGLANIPLLGKLFQSRSLNKSNSELLVTVTPEIIEALPAGEKMPGLELPSPLYLKDAPTQLPVTSGPAIIGKIAVQYKDETIPVEQITGALKAGAPAAAAGQVASPATPVNPESLNPGLNSQSPFSAAPGKK